MGTNKDSKELWSTTSNPILGEVIAKGGTTAPTITRYTYNPLTFKPNDFNHFNQFEWQAGVGLVKPKRRKPRKVNKSAKIRESTASKLAHGTDKEAIGFLKYYDSSVYASRLEGMTKSPIGLRDGNWLIQMEAFDGAVLPPRRVLAKLLVQGKVKLTITEEGKKDLKAAYGKLMMKKITDKL